MAAEPSTYSKMIARTTHFSAPGSASELRNNVVTHRTGPTKVLVPVEKPTISHRNKKTHTTAQNGLMFFPSAGAVPKASLILGNQRGTCTSRCPGRVPRQVKIH